MAEYLALLVFLSGTGLAAQTTSSNYSTEIHLMQLEQTVKDLQSQSQIQDQKYAALLSNILTKLTDTMDEMVGFKSELKAVKTELQSVTSNYHSLQHNFSKINDKVISQDKEILRLQSELKVSESNYKSVFDNVSKLFIAVDKSKETINVLHADTDVVRSECNATAAYVKDLAVNMDYLKVTVNNSRERVAKVDTQLSDIVKDQDSTRNKVNITQRSLEGLSSTQLTLKWSAENTSKKLTVLSETVGQLTQTVQSATKTLNFLRAGVMFQGWDRTKDANVQKGEVWKTSDLKGRYYNSTSGGFTAPAKGFYFLWVNGFVQLPDNETDARVHIRRDNYTVGIAYGRADQQGGFTRVIGMTISYLDAGSKIHFIPSVSVTFLGTVSSFGGFLL